MATTLQPDRYVIADRGYGARTIIYLVGEHGCRAHIPTRQDRKVQRSVNPAFHRERNLSERIFNRLKNFRQHSVV